MQQLIGKLRSQFPEIGFRQDARFVWSPEQNQVTYRSDVDNTEGIWALLHETSHALLGHNNYQNDFELLTMELDAWERAKLLAKEFDAPEIDENHIQDCLDTYRDWLHKRCLCPSCGARSFQEGCGKYSCHNCTTSWNVSQSRFCRTYRLIETK